MNKQNKIIIDSSRSGDESSVIVCHYGKTSPMEWAAESKFLYEMRINMLID